MHVQLMQGDKELHGAFTNSDGRIASMLPANSHLSPGMYQLVFDSGSYFPSGLYPRITIEFKVSQAQEHLHIPLLISPFGYCTYRGS